MYIKKQVWPAKSSWPYFFLFFLKKTGGMGRANQARGDDQRSS